MQVVSREKLTSAMLRVGTGVAGLSRNARVSQYRVSELSNRGGAARNSTIYKLATALGVEPTDLLEPATFNPNSGD